MMDLYIFKDYIDVLQNMFIYILSCVSYEGSLGLLSKEEMEKFETMYFIDLIRTYLNDTFHLIYTHVDNKKEYKDAIFFMKLTDIVDIIRYNYLYEKETDYLKSNICIEHSTRNISIAKTEE